MAAGVQGNEIEPAGADAISEVHNMLPDARSEEKSAVAELSSECCKSATDAQPEENPRWRGYLPKLTVCLRRFIVTT